jgi:hypothetical protein
MKGKQEDQIRDYLSTPVIEADLSKMPATVLKLQAFKENPQRQGMLIGSEVGSAVQFMVRDGTKDTLLLSQKTPFVLINKDPESKTSSIDEEKILMFAFKDLFSGGAAQRGGYWAEVQNVKYLLYIGWSVRELSLYMLRADDVKDFANLIFKGSVIFNAARSLETDGYPNPMKSPYYYTFDMGDDFPLRFRPEMTNEPYNMPAQRDIFQIVHFNPKTSTIVIRSPLYLSEELIRKILKPKRDILTSQYDASSKAIRTETPADLVEDRSLVSLDVIKKDVARIMSLPLGALKDLKFEERMGTEAMFERKHISDYPQAAELIKDLCEKVSSPEKTIRFDNLEVVVGPWQMAAGFLGGYTSAKLLAQNGVKPPLEPVPGFKVMPPVILVDNNEYPSVGDRITIILHEYRHHINSQLWIESPYKTEMPSQGSSPQEQMKWKVDVYLSDPNERLAHITQFKYMLGVGASPEEILRESMGGRPTSSNLPLAKKYLELINEARKEMKFEEDEKNRREALTEAIADASKSDEEDDFIDPEELNRLLTT